MGNKLRLVQHDDLKGGIISMFIHVLKEICVSAALLPIHTSLLPALICWISSLNAAVFVRFMLH